VQAFEGLTAVSIPVMPPVGTKLYAAPPQSERQDDIVGKLFEENQRLLAEPNQREKDSAPRQRPNPLCGND